MADITTVLRKCCDIGPKQVIAFGNAELLQHAILDVVRNPAIQARTVEVRKLQVPSSHGASPTLLEIEKNDHISSPEKRIYQMIDDTVYAVEPTSIPKGTVLLATRVTKCDSHNMEHFYKLVELAIGDNKGKMVDISESKVKYSISEDLLDQFAKHGISGNVKSTKDINTFPFSFATESSYHVPANSYHSVVVQHKDGIAVQAASAQIVKRPRSKDTEIDLENEVTKGKNDDAPKSKRQRGNAKSTSSKKSGVLAQGPSTSSVTPTNGTSSLLGTEWTEILANKKRVSKLPPRSADNIAPAPPTQLPPPVKIIWNNQVYDGIPQNDSESSQSTKPFSLDKGVTFQGWLNSPDAAYDYLTLNDKGEGGILMLPCTREQGRKGGIVDKSRVYSREFQPWFKFGINKKTGLPTTNCCKSDSSMKGAKPKAVGEQNKATDEKSKTSDMQVEPNSKESKASKEVEVGNEQKQVDNKKTVVDAEDTEGSEENN